ncbi:MAG: hypothetical protein HRU50_05505 [Winogradskyella sp.]|uniref:hypothetical protein n=1 Tax=Winogradskyella sp. TaxID=1883156 RepID=UPI0025FE0255|nr:hypothetical protein [Winogradskyella sp.]NRB59386.1 hypothetical protein [Winogradskyella sp.]
MGFSFSKLLGRDKIASEDTIEAIIASVEHKPYGISESNVLFSGMNELGGYLFFQTVIVGDLSTKVKNGATLTFKGNDFELTLSSDSLEFESSPTETKGRNATSIDFQIEESDIKKLQNAKLKEIVLKVKKQEILFKKYKTRSDN